MSSYHLIIDGKPAAATATFNVLNPADESIVATCPEGTTALVDAAVAAARRAFAKWSAVPDAERVAKLNAIADLIEKNEKELAELVTREQGKPQSGPGAHVEVGGAAAWTRVTAGLTLPEQVIQDDKASKIVAHRKPIGVVASITPWNWPLMIAVWHIMPAIRVGCTVVIKPSPFTPLSTLRLVELMNQVLPPGVINVVTGGPEVGTHLVNHSGVDKIVFTGSIATGKKVMGGAAETLKRMTLELGGNDAGIVLPGHPHRATVGEALLGLLHQRRPDLRGPEAAVRARGPVRGGGPQVRRLRAPRFRSATGSIRRISSAR